MQRKSLTFNFNFTGAKTKCLHFCWVQIEWFSAGSDLIINLKTNYFFLYYSTVFNLHFSFSKCFPQYYNIDFLFLVSWQAVILQHLLVHFTSTCCLLNFYIFIFMAVGSQLSRGQSNETQVASCKTVFLLLLIVTQDVRHIPSLCTIYLQLNVRQLLNRLIRNMRQFSPSNRQQQGTAELFQIPLVSAQRLRLKS